MEQDVQQKPTGKLESLPKEELLKFIKRQAISSKDLKKKLADLEHALSKEKEECNNNALESQDLRDKLQAAEKDSIELKAIYNEENNCLKDMIRDLEEQLANPVEYNKLKDEFDELEKVNKLLMEDKLLAEHDRTAKSEQILGFDKEIKSLRQEVAEKNRVIKDKKYALETVETANVELSEALKAAQDKCQELQVEIQKTQQEKEKYLKAIKSMKTKMERNALIEEELRKQLNAIVGERDEMLKKNLKHAQKQRKDSTGSAKKEELLGELKTQISTLEAEKSDWSKKYDDLQTSLETTQEELQKLRSEKESEKKEAMASEDKSVDKLAMEGESTDLDGEIQELKKELDMFKRDAPETKATIVKLECRITDLLNELQTLTEEKLTQESSLEELFKTNDDLSNQYDLERKEREKKEEEIAHLDQKLRALQEKEGKETLTCDLEQQVDLLEETINDMTAEKDHYRQELLVKEECIQQLRTDIEELHRKNTTMSSTTANEIERCTQEIDTLRTQLMSLSTELECSSKESEETKLQLQNVLQEKEELSRSFDACEANISVLKSQFDAKVLECEELKQEMREPNTPNNSLANDKPQLVDIQDQQEGVRNLHDDTDHLENRYKQVSEENIVLKEEFQVLVETKTACQNDLHEIKLSLDQYTNENVSLKNELSQFIELTEKYGYNNVFDFDVYVTSLSSEVLTSTRMLQELSMEKELLDFKCLELESKMKTETENESGSTLESEIKLMKNEIAHTEIQEKEEILPKNLVQENMLQENVQQRNENLADWEDKGSAESENQEKLQTELYKEEIRCLNQTIETLQNELRDLKVQESATAKSDNEEKCGSLQEELVLQLSRNLKESQLFAENLKFELEENDLKMKELTMKYEQSEENYKHLKDINTRMEENYSSLESAHACALDEKEKVVEQLNQVNDVTANVESKLQTALEKMIMLQNELQEKEEAINELQTALSEKEDTINELNSLLEEKGNQGSKYKNAAVKARKELENLRQKYDMDTSSLKQQIENVKDEFNCVEAELTRQKTECSKHEEEFEEFQVEIKNLQSQIEKERDSMRAMEEVLREKEDDALKLKGKLQEKQTELETLKPKMEDLQKNLDGALQQHQQHLVKSLEIGDYEKTVDNMQNSLNEKERHIAEAQTSLDRMTEMQRNVETELGAIKKEKGDLETRSEKLKAMIVKLKKELSEKQQEQQKTEEQVQLLEKTIEEFKQNLEAMKIEAIQLNTEKNDLKNELKSCAELHEKQYKTLEVKFARSTNDLLAAQRENATLSQEFEQYKVRAHNVLKQQKSKQHEEEEKEENQQNLNRLEKVIQDLKEKLCASNEDLGELEGRYNDLQQEYDGLQARHHEFIEEIGGNELAWKQKVAQVKLEASTKVLEYQDKLQVIQCEKDNLIRKAQERKEEEVTRTHQLETEEREKYEAKIEKLCEENGLLKDELALLKRKRQENPPNILDLAQNNSGGLYVNQDSVDSRGNESVEFKCVSERQEGEGMDSKELEIIDTLSQQGSLPHTPSTPSHASILERLLSPAQIPALASPQSPTALAQELAFAKTSLQTAVKKNEHMTALIRESEANACRLADQAKVLKEEIRRLERNEEREQALSNMEYLKNVIIKFLKVGSIEKKQLIPVLSTMLKLSDEEKNFIFEYAKGGEVEEDDGTGSWSSYVYRWTSLS